MVDGKKSVAQGVFYRAMEIVAQKVTDVEPIEVFNRALENCKPSVEVRSKRVGGAAYQVPMQVNRNRQQSLGIRWMLQAVRAKKGRATHEHDRVLLQVVPFTRDVDGHFLLIREPHAGDLSQGGVRLLGGHRAHLQAHSALLRAAVEHGRLGKLALRPATAANKLADRGHTGSLTEGAGIALVNAFGIPRGGNPKM